MINYPGCFDLSTYMTVLNILHKDCYYLVTTCNMMMEKISTQVVVMPSKGHVSYKREDVLSSKRDFYITVYLVHVTVN